MNMNDLMHALIVGANQSCGLEGGHRNKASAFRSRSHLFKSLRYGHGRLVFRTRPLRYGGGGGGGGGGLCLFTHVCHTSRYGGGACVYSHVSVIHRGTGGGACVYSHVSVIHLSHLKMKHLN